MTMIMMMMMVVVVMIVYFTSVYVHKNKYLPTHIYMIRKASMTVMMIMIMAGSLFGIHTEHINLYLPIYI
jgi:hypothetical protein